MYSLACINLSSEAHPSDALGSSQYPVLKVPKGPCPTLAPRCGARKNYTSIPHAVSRKILKKFSDPLRKVGTAAMIINIIIIHFSVYRRLPSLSEDRRRCSDKERRWKRNLTNTW